MNETSPLTLTRARIEIGRLCQQKDYLGAYFFLAQSDFSVEASPGLWDFLARQLRDGGEEDLAARVRKELWSAGHLGGRTALDEAEIARDQADFAHAIAVLDAAFGRESTDEEVNLLYGQAFSETDPESAIEHLKRISVRTLTQGLTLIDALRRADRLREALEMVDEIEGRFPRDARVAARRARVLESLKDWSGAAREWRALADTDFQFRATGLVKLVDLSRRLEQFEQADQAVTELLLAIGEGTAPSDLRTQIDALTVAGQPEALYDWLNHQTAHETSHHGNAAEWARIASGFIDEGRIGLVGWMRSRGLPVGDSVAAILDAAPLRDQYRMAMRGPIELADKVVTPDALLEQLGKRCKRPVTDTQPDDRVLLVNSTLAAGGAERQFITLIRALTRSGVAASRIHVALFSVAKERGHAHFLSALERSGVNIHVLPTVPTEVGDLPNLDLISAFPRQLRSDILRLLPLVRRLRPAILHGWQDRSSMACGLTGLLLGTPRIIMSARNMRPELRGEGQLQTMRGLFRMLCETNGIALTVNSEVGARDYETWLGLPTGAALTLHNGLDLSAFPMARKLAPNTDQPIEILGVFRLAANKRPLLWLQTVAELRRRLPFKIRPRLVGNGPFLDRILAEHSDLGLDDLILQDGLEDPAEIYGGADVLLLMSRVEGTPNVVIEAQAAGLAIAACDVGGVREALYQSGKGAGLLLPAEIEHRDAAESVAQWLPTALGSYGNERRGHIERTYGLEALAARTLDAYSLTQIHAGSVL